MGGDAIVLYPYPGLGHLISMVELGKLLLTHHPSFSITILASTAPTTIAATAKLVASSNDQLTNYIKAVSANNPAINFHHLPTISSLPDHIEKLNLPFEYARLQIPNILQVLQTLKSSLKALILDMFCDALFDVAKDLNIPTFYFYTSAGRSLAVLLNIPTFHRTTNSLSDFGDVPISISGMPPIPVSAIPKLLFDRSTNFYKSFLSTSTHMAKSNGIILNTFDLLEERALKALRAGLCLPNQPTPPIFTVGPLISGKSEDNDEHESLKWLNNQPKDSVLFLCFGSMGVFSIKQLEAMALGLEKSGRRFLWVVRNPPIEELPVEEPSLEEILPKGFVERTRDRGLVVRKWAPQVEVLSHDSVGGFVTHCGWNSVLEAVCNGVPMVAWPLYAEQKLGRVFLVEEMKVAVGVKETETGFVSADELEKRVRELMDSESGDEIRGRVLEFRNGGVKAKEEGGSSVASLAKLAQLWKQK
uniref:Glycosyltransferase n=1 Tax=Rosa hybrid cultivar TaxID=128735 RepID=Q2PGW6_ROSHC|nr:UDP-glucose: anthocyanidin 5,3-O-glucosyltransferase [Rosa hybrid cultivar]